MQTQLSCSLQSSLSSRLQCIEVVRMGDGKHFLCMGADAQVWMGGGSAWVTASTSFAWVQAHGLLRLGSGMLVPCACLCPHCLTARTGAPPMLSFPSN